MDQQEQSFKMGKRLKELRESKGLSHEKLKKIMMEEYHIKISRDSLMSYEISDEFHSKAEKCPNLKMRVEYLNCFSDLYGVSADYLLGKTDIKNPDISVREICEYTGLSDTTVERLKMCHDCAVDDASKRVFSAARIGDPILYEKPIYDLIDYAVSIGKSFNSLANAYAIANIKANGNLDRRNRKGAMVKSLFDDSSTNVVLSANEAIDYYKIQMANLFGKRRMTSILSQYCEEIGKTFAKEKEKYKKHFEWMNSDERKAELSAYHRTEEYYNIIERDLPIQIGGICEENIAKMVEKVPEPERTAFYNRLVAKFLTCSEITDASQKKD